MRAMSVRLPDEMHERLRREAFEQRRPMNELVIEALTAHFKGWDQDDSGPWTVSRAAARPAVPTGPKSGDSHE